MRVVGVLVALLVCGQLAHAAPTLAPGSYVTADIINCSSATCWTGWLVLPKAWTAPRRQLVFEGVDKDFAITTSITSAHGDLNHNAAPSDAIAITKTTIVGGKAYVEIAISRGLEPDQYHGSFRVEFADGAIDVPVDLRVRMGPLVPLLFILIGLVAGFALKWWNSSGKRKADTLAAISQLEASVERDPTTTRDILRPMLAELVVRIEPKVDTAKLDAIDADLANVEKRRSQLLTLERLAEILGENHREIARVRGLISIREDAKATEALRVLVDSVDAPAVGPVAFSIHASVRREVPPAPKRSWRSRAIEKYAGHAFRVLMVLLLLFIGLDVLYVNGVADFGARPLHDLLGLILWGLGSEITSRPFGTLGELIGKRVTSSASTDSKPAGKPVEKPKPGLKLPDDEIVRVKPGAPVPFSDDKWPRAQLDRDVLDAKDWKGKDTVIAVIDTGVSPARTELAHDRIIKPFEDIDGGDGVDQHGHGTCMIGLLASTIGLCTQTKILSIRALDENGNGTSAGLVKGIEIAIAKNVDVISISAGQPEDDPALAAAVQKAVDAGIVVVGAIRKESPSSPAYPAAYEGAIAITPSKKNEHLLFPQPPDWIDVGAPGVLVPTFDLAGPATITGSSPAAALVAGVCVLLLSSKTDKAARRALAKKLPEILRNTAKTVDGGRLIVVREAVKEVEKL